ncbi:MAG: hypothetical protein IKI58_02820 [Oscillospiraceae bacterium]|nr:hypothetical protein [Oscillospiraceae bacterium]
MKSLFKRTLATATGSVLALSQLVSVAATVNVSAADTLPVDKAFVLNVPVDTKAPLKAEQVSDWSDQLEAKFTELGDNYTVQFGTQRVKKQAKEFLVKHASKYMSSEDMDALLAKIASTGTAVTNMDGSYTITLECDEVGDVIGEIFQNLYSEGKVPVDWTQFSVKGKLVVKGKINFADKTATYGLVLIDETGKEFTGDAGIQLYAEQKLDEAKAICLAADSSKADKIEEVYEALSNKINYIRLAIESVFDLSNADAIEDEDLVENESFVTEGITDPEEAYETFAASKILQVYSTDIPDAVKQRMINAYGARVPATLAELLSDERVTSRYNQVVDIINNNYEGVQIDFTLEDVSSIIDEGYDYDINIPNGYSFNGTFSIADDQTDEVLDAVKAVYTEDGFIAGADLETLAGYASDDAYQTYTVVDGSGTEVTDFTKDYTVIGVTSHKEISGGNQIELFDLTQGTVSYDVERVIEQIIVEEVKETESTTTTTETTSSTTESTTTTTETTSSTTDSTTTTTETTSSTTESTTTTTETTSSTTESTTTTTETTSSTTGTTTTDTTTTTTLATYVSFDVGANGYNELIYWSEESDATFDFNEISIKAHFIVAGEDQTEDIVDVSEFFGAEANTPAEMGIALSDGVGSGKFPVGLVLKDEDGLRQVIVDQGYDASVMEDQAFSNGATVAKFYVILVLRGDANLDGTIDVTDAQDALSHYTDGLAKHGPTHTFRTANYLGEYEDPMAYYAYSHYAMDANEGDGVINIDDAQTILAYYTWNLAQKNPTWDGLTGQHAIPQNILHADPLANDTLGKAEYEAYWESRN